MIQHFTIGTSVNGRAKKTACGRNNRGFTLVSTENKDDVDCGSCLKSKSMTRKPSTRNLNAGMIISKPSPNGMCQWCCKPAIGKGIINNGTDALRLCAGCSVKDMVTMVETFEEEGQEVAENTTEEADDPQQEDESSRWAYFHKNADPVIHENDQRYGFGGIVCPECIEERKEEDNWKAITNANIITIGQGRRHHSDKTLRD